MKATDKLAKQTVPVQSEEFYGKIKSVPDTSLFRGYPEALLPSEGNEQALKGFNVPATLPAPVAAALAWPAQIRRYPPLVAT